MKIYCKEGISRILDNSLKKMAYVISEEPLWEYSVCFIELES